jgi:hypothetical protein
MYFFSECIIQSWGLRIQIFYTANVGSGDPQHVSSDPQQVSSDPQPCLVSLSLSAKTPISVTTWFGRTSKRCGEAVW